MTSEDLSNLNAGVWLPDLDEDDSLSGIGSHPEIERQLVSIVRQLKALDIDPEYALLDVERYFEEFGPPKPRTGPPINMDAIMADMTSVRASAAWHAALDGPNVLLERLRRVA